MSEPDRGVNATQLFSSILTIGGLPVIFININKLSKPKHSSLIGLFVSTNGLVMSKPDRGSMLRNFFGHQPYITLSFINFPSTNTLAYLASLETKRFFNV
jgi:hypothetical protein